MPVGVIKTFSVVALLRNSFLSALLLFSTCACLQAAELPVYDIEASFDPVRHTITARQKVTFTNNYTADVTELYFHIYPHRKFTHEEIRFLNRYASYFKVNPFPDGFQSGDLIVKSVVVDGVSAGFSVEGGDETLLKIPLPGRLPVHASCAAEIEYEVRIPHTHNRFGWHGTITTLTRWYPILCMYDDKGWRRYPFYIYHQPFFSEASWYSLRLTMPGGYTAVTGCSLEKEEQNPDGTRTVCLRSDAPMRDLGVGISPDFKRESIVRGGVTVNAYYIGDTRRAAEDAAKFAGDMIEFCSARFGAYPYKEFNIVPSYLGFGGDQSSGLIFINTRLFRLPGFLSRYFDFLISHETGHQWFYNVIGSDEYRQMFMDEGVNSYWVLRYLESKYGYNAGILDIPRYLRWVIPDISFRESTAARYFYVAKTGYDRPVISDLSSFREPSSIFALAYGKGSAVLQMLEKQMGTEGIDRAFSRYAREFRFRNASLDDLVSIVTDESGKDMSPFFDQWLKSADFCDFSVKRFSAHSAVVENRGNLRMPVDIMVGYTDGTSEMRTWDGEGEQYEFTVPPDKKAASVTVDPEKKIILDIDRTNNHCPRQFVFRPVPLYFFAYELPLLLDRDAYNVVAGPGAQNSALGITASVQKPYDQLLRISCGYDVNGKAVDSRLGYEAAHIGHSHTSAGFEIFDYESAKAGDDLTGGKVYIRRDLWPASYGLFSVNDHVSLYFVRNRKYDRAGGWSGSEDIRNNVYRKHEEAIAGFTGSFGRYGPADDPNHGWRIISTQEVAGHFAGGKESFWRSSAELQRYFLLMPRWQHTCALRGKIGTGGPADKTLYDIGGAQALRGYGVRDVRGARMALGGVEYRMPLVDNIKIYLLDNIARLRTIQSVFFYDIGKAWHSDYSDADFKKDAGAGLRLHFDICGILERVVVRIDVAQAINEKGKNPRVWFGINQSF